MLIPSSKPLATDRACSTTASSSASSFTSYTNEPIEKFKFASLKASFNKPSNLDAQCGQSRPEISQRTFIIFFLSNEILNITSDLIIRQLRTYSTIILNFL